MSLITENHKVQLNAETDKLLVPEPNSVSPLLAGSNRKATRREHPEQVKNNFATKESKNNDDSAVTEIEQNDKENDLSINLDNDTSRFKFKDYAPSKDYQVPSNLDNSRLKNIHISETSKSFNLLSKEPKDYVFNSHEKTQSLDNSDRRISHHLPDAIDLNEHRYIPNNDQDDSNISQESSNDLGSQSSSQSVGTNITNASPTLNDFKQWHILSENEFGNTNIEELRSTLLLANKLIPSLTDELTKTRNIASQFQMRNKLLVMETTEAAQRYEVENNIIKKEVEMLRANALRFHLYSSQLNSGSVETQSASSNINSINDTYQTSAINTRRRKQSDSGKYKAKLKKANARLKAYHQSLKEKISEIARLKSSITKYNTPDPISLRLGNNSSAPPTRLQALGFLANEALNEAISRPLSFSESQERFKRRKTEE